jgi:hypothetical protein
MEAYIESMEANQGKREAVAEHWKWTPRVKTTHM